MGVQHVLNLARVHRVAVAQHHVLDAVHDKDIAVGIHTSHVPGRKPLTVEHSGGCLGVIPVTEHHVLAAHPQLAALLRRALNARRVAHLNLHTRQDAAHRTQHHAEGRLVEGDHGRGFAQAVALVHGTIGQLLPSLVHRSGQSRTTRNAEAHRTAQAGATLRLLSHEGRKRDVHARHGRQHRHPGRLNQAQRVVGCKARKQRHRRAGRKSRVHRHRLAEGME